MKKTYSTPEICILGLNLEDTLMTGSITVKNGGSDEGTVNEQWSQKRNIWSSSNWDTEE